MRTSRMWFLGACHWQFLWVFGLLVVPWWKCSSLHLTWASDGVVGFLPLSSFLLLGTSHHLIQPTALSAGPPQSASLVIKCSYLDWMASWLVATMGAGNVAHCPICWHSMSRTDTFVEMMDLCGIYCDGGCVSG
jgi:hypothetical protein